MPRPKFLNSKSIVQVFEESLMELWQAIKELFWEIIATYRLKHTGIKVSKETQEKAKKSVRKLRKIWRDKMAKGYWRNWDLIECPRCGCRVYKKYLIGDRCPACGEKLGEELRKEKRERRKR